MNDEWELLIVEFDQASAPLALASAISGLR
jgi:hypothetical protein